MTPESVSIEGPSRTRQGDSLSKAVGAGLIFGVVGVYLAAVGILPMIQERVIIVGILTMGQAALLGLGLGTGAYISYRPARYRLAPIIARAAIGGAAAGGLLAALVAAMAISDVRSVFIALSPALMTQLTFGLPWGQGALLLVAMGGALSAVGAFLQLSPPLIRKSALIACSAVILFGSFQELMQIMMRFGGVIGTVREALYTWEGLTPQGALWVFVVAVCVNWLRVRFKVKHPSRNRMGKRDHKKRLYRAAIVVALLILFPLLGGPYVGQVMMLVGLYCLMGMGLNLEVGLAGLLDLGFVAFFAVGAYATALLTADSPHALAAFTSIPHVSYWVAMPIAVLASVSVGVLFGIPVLGVRGDYLAVATMGLGEIVRVIVQSDAAAPLLAGGEGILQIPKPWLGSFELRDPVDLYFLTLACAALAAYVAWRLEGSRLGRAWMAVRDDEDIAQALGINLVKVKLLGYGLGAAFAGLAGSIFAVMVGSVYPSSFQLLVSINVLALIVVGGMGSLPGVVVGAAVLVGLPELLREFAEYRYLVYGVALIVMMRIRPEGLWPSVTRSRELRDAATELAK